MKTWILAAAAPLALAFGSAPLAAQATDDEAREAEVMAQLSTMFAVEPLTPEQEARLPLAAELVARVMPEGTLGEVMDTMFDGFLGPIMEMAEKGGPQLSNQIGYGAGELGLDDEQAAEVATLVDPDWEERQKREIALLRPMMSEVMSAMEPAMRQGMTEAYAVHFTEAELRDIAAFFGTESGATFARKSYTLASDPRIMSAAMSEMPTMMGQFKEAAEKMKAATADLGEKRRFETLSAEQKARILAITGLSETELQIGMEVAAEKASKSPFG